MSSARRALLDQVARYLGVGGFVWLVDLSVFALLLQLPSSTPVAANVAGRIAGAGVGFVLHRRWTFQPHCRDGVPRQLAAYLALLLFNLALSTGLLWLLADRLHAPPLLAKLAADVIVIASAFLLSRLFVFRAAAPSSDTGLRC